MLMRRTSMKRTRRKAMPSQAVLCALLRYEPDTGQLFWRERRDCSGWNQSMAGCEAFTTVTNGYRQGTVLGERFGAHRVIWKLVHGTDPDQIDHIDGDRLNNRVENLRDVSAVENQRNKRIAKNNTSGICGVHFERQTHKWDAAIYVQGKRVRLGRFDTMEDAREARKAAERQYGFSARHGARV